MSWRIHTGDCLRLMRDLPSNAVAAVITDPPYSSGGAMRSDRMATTGRKYTQGGTLTHRADFAGDNRDQMSYGYWSALWLGECLRVTKPGGVCLVFTDWRQMSVTIHSLQAGGWIWRGIVPWDKTESARPDKGRFRNQCEYVVWGSKGPLGVAPPHAPCLPGLVRTRVRRSDKHHIAGKPTDLMRALVRIAWQGGTILDPFCGSGTTGVAAIAEGLDFIGYEVIATYAEQARGRCAAAVSAIPNTTSAIHTTNARHLASPSSCHTRCYQYHTNRILHPKRRKRTMTGCSQKPMLGSQTSTMASLGPRGFGYDHAPITPSIPRVRTDSRQAQIVDHMTPATDTTPDPHDFNPIVGLDDEPAASSALSAAEQSYLRSQGITDERTWSAFRLGKVDDATMTRLGLTGRRRFTSMGIRIPTFDPRDPTTAVGVVRLTPAQNKHAFVTPPHGIAGADDISTAPCIVIADNPLLALRLHHAGVRGVMLVEDIAVLAPLLDGFANRDLMLCSYKQASIDAIRTALGPHGERAVSALVGYTLATSATETLALLGLNRDVLRGPIEPALPLTDRLLNELHTYAVGQLAHPDAPAVLALWGFDHPDLAEAWHVGFLPSDFRNALSPEQRRTFAGHFHGGSLIIPAYDASGHMVVDLVCAQGCERGHSEFSAWEHPRGLIAASVVTAFDRVTMTDSLKQATRWFAAGDRAVLLLRGAADARANAQRLADSGVRNVILRVRRESHAMGEALTAAGIAVTRKRRRERVTEETEHEHASPHHHHRHHESETARLTSSITNESLSAPPPIPARLPALTLIRHDSTRDEAVFSIGDLTITAQVPWSQETVLRVMMARHDRRCVDRVDIAQPAQRRRFAASAALRLELSPEVIERAMADLLPALRHVVETEDEPVSPLATWMSNAEEGESLADLRRPDLVARILAWLTDLGLHGDDDERFLLFLSALSRKSDEPMWLALLTASPLAGQPIDLMVEATPPEEIVAANSLTDHALINSDPGMLRHRLVVLHDAQRVSPAVATALRILHRRGALSRTKVERNPVRGTVRTTMVEAIGPVALLTTGITSIDERLRPCVVEITADESPVHTERALIAERNRRADPRRYAHARAVSLRRLRNLQRLITARSVLIPFTDDLAPLSHGPHAQREQATLLALITTHALLHQHQRLSDHDAVVATRADLAVAQRLAQRFVSAQANGLGVHAQRLLTAVRAAGVQSVTMDTLETTILPGWSRHALRVGLTELVAVNYLASPRLGRGHRRIYHAVRSGPNTYDAHNRKVCELAEVGDDQKPTLSHEGKSG